MKAVQGYYATNPLELAAADSKGRCQSSIHTKTQKPQFHFVLFINSNSYFFSFQTVFEISSHLEPQPVHFVKHSIHKKAKKLQLKESNHENHGRTIQLFRL